MKIGFLDRTQANWTAGASYTRSMVRALADARPPDCELVVLSGRQSSFDRLPDRVGAIRIDVEVLSLADIRAAVATHDLDVLLPVTEALLPDTACALIGWVPDFQHRHLPEYFSGEEITQRDRYFGYLIDNCDGMMFSSEAVRADFHALYPGFAGESGCAPFPSSFAYADGVTDGVTDGDPRFVRGKYGLPDGYVLVANQFWKHKNHLHVVEAVARARRAQPAVHVVMVGVPADARDPRNSHLSELFRRLSVERLFPQLTVLGEVPLGDLVALLRGALEVVQPSRFEGWNTTVEDALALGKPVACSDLATHREQAPGAFFFPPDDAGPLAAHWEALDWTREGWGGADSENAGLAAERQRGAGWASGLIAFCRQVKAARDARGHRGGGRPGWIEHDPAEDIKRHPLLYNAHLEQQNAGLQKRGEALEENIRALREAQSHLRDALRDLRGERDELRNNLRTEKNRAEAAAREAWAEKSKPLRQRVAEEMHRRLAGKTLRPPRRKEP